MEIGKTIVIRKDDMVIKFEQNEDGSLDAWRLFDQDPDKSYRLYDLDAMDLGHALATVNRFLTDSLPDVYLEPRDSSLRRRLSMS